MTGKGYTTKEKKQKHLFGPMMGFRVGVGRVYKDRRHSTVEVLTARVKHDEKTIIFIEGRKIISTSNSFVLYLGFRSYGSPIISLR
jgi:hypothetical protein